MVGVGATRRDSSTRWLHAGYGPKSDIDFYYDVEAEVRPLLFANYVGLTGMRVFSEAMNKYAGDHDNGKLTDIISILMHRKSWEGLELNRSMWFPSILGTAGSEHGRTLFKLSSRGSDSSQLSRCTRRGHALGTYRSAN